MSKTTSPAGSSGPSVGVIALALATVALGATSVYLRSELRDEREHVQSLKAHIDELEKTRPVPPNPFAAAAPAPEPIVESSPAPAATAVVRADATPPPLTPPDAAFQSARAALMGRQRLLQDPEYRKAMLEQQKYALERMHPDLRSALQLQPEEADKLLELLAEQQLEFTALMPPGRNGRPEDLAEMQKRRDQIRQEFEARIAQTFGDTKLEQWQQYQKTLGARSQIRDLRVELAEAGIPLRESQIEPLVSSLAAEQQRRAQESQNYRAQLNALGNTTPANRIMSLEQELERTAEYHRRLHDAAAPYLSREQLRRFDQNLDRQLQMQRAALEMMRAQQAAIERGDIPAPSVSAGRMMRAMPAPSFVAAEPAVMLD